MSEDARETPDEKSSINSKLESMSKEALVKIMLSQQALQKKLNANISQLTTSNLSLCQTEELLRNQLDDEQLKSTNLLAKLEHSRKNELKLQQELNVTQESMECFRLQNDTLKSSCQNLQAEISNLQRSLSELRQSLTNVEEDFTNRLEQSQTTIETLLSEKESFSEERSQLEQSIAHLRSISEELRGEIEHLRVQLNNVDQEKHSMEEEIHQYRQELEDFKSQALQRSHVPQPSFVESNDESTVSDCLSTLLQHIDQHDQQIFNVFPDIPALLESVGIVNTTFPRPFDLESLLRLSSLLYERCQALQTVGDDLTETTECVSSIQTDELEEYRAEIPQQACRALDSILQQLCTWMNHSVDSPTWHMVLSKPLKEESDQQYISLSLNDLTFFPGHIRDDLMETRARLDQLAKENEKQRYEMSLLQQSNEINVELQNLLNQQAADQTKCEQLKSDYDREHLRLLEGEETIRLLQIEIDQVNNDHQTHWNQLQQSFNEEQRLSSSSTRDQDERYGLLLKQQQQLSDLLETKINEGKQLAERNLQLEEDLKEHRELFFEKSKQADDLDRQLQKTINQCEELRSTSEHLRNEKNKAVDELNHLSSQMENLNADKAQLTQTIEALREELQNNQSNFDQKLQDYNEGHSQDRVQTENQLTETIGQLERDLEAHQNDLQDLQSKFDEQEHTHTTVLRTLQSKFDEQEQNYTKVLEDLQSKYDEQERSHSAILQDLQSKFDEQQQSHTKVLEDLRSKYAEQEQSHTTILQELQYKYDEQEQSHTTVLENLQSKYDKQQQSNTTALQDLQSKFDEQERSHTTVLQDRQSKFDEQQQSHTTILQDLRSKFDEQQQSQAIILQDLQSKFDEHERSHSAILQDLQSKFDEQQQRNTEVLQDLQSKYDEQEQSHTTASQDLRSQLEQLQQEKNDLHRTNEQLNQKLEDRIRDSNVTIQDLKEKQQKMKILLARLKKELDEKNQQPKQSLIDLEIADYERTIKTLKENLTSKDKEIEDLRGELTGNNEKSARLREEMHTLEEQKSQTEERANKFQTLFESTKKELQDAKDLEHERHYNDDNVRSLIDKLQVELDNNKVSISQLLGEKQQLTERLHSQTDTAQRTIQLLEQNLRITQHDLSLAKQDYDTLHDDFNNYKIRAQSVLKQHQSTPREPQPTVMNRQVELEETIGKLQERLEDSNRHIQSLIADNERLQKEQDRLSEVQTRLINESRKREQELRRQHQTELEKLENDSYELTKNISLQNETLSTSFKEKIAAIEADHARSLSMLQSQYQAAKQEIEQWKTRLELVRQNNVENEKEPSPVTFSIESSRDDLPWTHAERQQGEGSESASSEYPSTDIAVKTLENVLFGGTTNTRPSSASADKPRHILFEDAELERQRVEEELSKTKYRLLNTTELLNESELNNVRLGEQVSLLKDEIRRIERNMDRAESISNLEYLKNIILKFFILKSTPERLQLIPVLVTMLKLSPDEQGQLVRVAQQTTSIENNSTNNELNTQSVTNSANANPPPSSSSWTSYLNIW